MKSSAIIGIFTALIFFGHAVCAALPVSAQEPPPSGCVVYGTGAPCGGGSSSSPSRPHPTYRAPSPSPEQQRMARAYELNEQGNKAYGFKTGRPLYSSTLKPIISVPTTASSLVT